MTVDHASVVEKKVQLQQAARVLKKLRSQPLKKIENDEITLGAVLHYLMIGIESILDIGSHILTEDFGVSPETYEDVIVLLGRKRVISSAMSQRSKGMGKFCNKLIHEYADINTKKVYAFLQKAPQSFEQYDKAFSVYLQKKRK